MALPLSIEEALTSGLEQDTCYVSAGGSSGSDCLWRSERSNPTTRLPHILGLLIVVMIVYRHKQGCTENYEEIGCVNFSHSYTASYFLSIELYCASLRSYGCVVAIALNRILPNSRLLSSWLRNSQHSCNKKF